MDTLVATKEIPIIDLNLLNINNEITPQRLDQLAKEFNDALTNHGTALIINHGIDDKKQQLCSDRFKKFCDLPDEIKFRYCHGRNTGYIKPGQETFKEGLMELRHSFNIDTISKDLMPDKYIPGFSDVVADLTNDTQKLAILILKCIAKALNFPEDEFLAMHSFVSDKFQKDTVVRLIHYPEVPHENDVYNSGHFIRCGAHCDYGTFTLLWQDSEGGLEICPPGTDNWRRVGYYPGAIFLNGGLILDKWTEKRYPPLRHRVVVPEEKSVRNRARFTNVLFLHAKGEVLVAPLRILKENDKEKLKDYETCYEFKEKIFRETYGREE